MRIINASPRGATIYVSDLKLRVGEQPVLLEVTSKVASSNNLREAIVAGLVRVELELDEQDEPYAELFLSWSDAAEKRKVAEVVLSHLEMMSREKAPLTKDVPVRPAVFLPVS